MLFRLVGDGCGATVLLGFWGSQRRTTEWCIMDGTASVLPSVALARHGRSACLCLRMLPVALSVGCWRARVVDAAEACVGAFPGAIAKLL